MPGCDRKSLRLWHSAFYRTVSRYRAAGRFLGKDQNLLATTCLETDLCLLLPGSQAAVLTTSQSTQSTFLCWDKCEENKSGTAPVLPMPSKKL